MADKDILIYRNAKKKDYKIYLLFNRLSSICREAIN